jgi:hypothetical protein
MVIFSSGLSDKSVNGMPPQSIRYQGGRRIIESEFLRRFFAGENHAENNTKMSQIYWYLYMLGSSTREQSISIKAETFCTHVH